MHLTPYVSPVYRQVRAVHATNRDAVAILSKNKKLRLEVGQLKAQLTTAMASQRDAEARESASGRTAPCMCSR